MASGRRLSRFALVALLAACGRSAFVATSGSATPTPAPTVTGFSHHRQITVSGAGLTTSLSGFPVPVVLDSSIDLSAALPGGADVRFFDLKGASLLYEIESWHPGTVGTNSVVWVLSPVIQRGTGAAFYMYLGNPAASDGQDAVALWASAGFSAVWHLGTNLAASTGPENDFNVTSAPDAPGLFGRGRSFDGMNGGYLSVNDNPSLDPSGQVTLSAWALPSQWNGNDRIVEKGATSSNGADGQYRLGRQNSGSKNPMMMSINNVGAAQTPNSDDAVGVWTHLAGTYDGQTLILYVDGQPVAQASGTSEIPPTNTPFNIGTKVQGDFNNGDWFFGTIDEVRLSAVARSADWIFAEYESGEGTLVTIGPPSQ